MIFVDTNYFLRFLLKDVSRQSKEAKKLFLLGVSGELKLFSSVIVFFEIYWVLTSFYEKKKAAIVLILQDLLSMSFIKWENSGILEKALKKYISNNIDLEDSYNLVYSQVKKAKSFKTFDQKLMKIAGK